MIKYKEISATFEILFIFVYKFRPTTCQFRINTFCLKSSEFIKIGLIRSTFCLTCIYSQATFRLIAQKFRQFHSILFNTQAIQNIASSRMAKHAHAELGTQFWVKNLRPKNNWS